MPRTRVKFCGITCAEDAQAAASAGADAIGAVFYLAVPTAVDVEHAASIFSVLPPFVSSTALFVNPDVELVREVINKANPSLLQFHGDEPPEFCTAFSRPYIKACRVGVAADIDTAMKMHPAARGILLDAKTKGEYGGTGKQFDWNLIPSNPPLPVSVAGGLTPDSVGGLLRVHRPWAVDVSSGICREGDRRRKDSDKMAHFMREVCNADK